MAASPLAAGAAPASPFAAAFSAAAGAAALAAFLLPPPSAFIMPLRHTGREEEKQVSHAWWHTLECRCRVTGE